MRESRLYGFVRGALSNERPYRVSGGSGVANGVPDILVPQVSLQRPRIAVRRGEAARMALHVRVRLEAKLRSLIRPKPAIACRG